MDWEKSPPAAEDKPDQEPMYSEEMVEQINANIEVSWVDICRGMLSSAVELCTPDPKFVSLKPTWDACCVLELGTV